MVDALTRWPWYLTACPELLALAAERLEAIDEEQQR